MKTLQDVIHIHADAQALGVAPVPPAVFSVGDSVSVQLLSQEAYLRVRLEEIDGITYAGTVEEGSTEGVERGDRVLFRDPYRMQT